MSSPNAIRALLSIWRARSVAAPGPFGDGSADHSGLVPALEAIEKGGTAAVPDVDDVLTEYCDQMSQVDPGHLSRDEALAFWINLYNAVALRMAARAVRAGYDSVLRVPGVFDSAMIEVGGEALSLDAIEHGKIRRFRDPRIHSALVCGAVSCPTLRRDPYVGPELQAQLDDQLRSFLARGGAFVDRTTGVLRLSRVFLWYGGDFTRPQRMPTWLPAPRQRLFRGLRPWLTGEAARWTGRPRIVFQSYDWGLRCAVG